MVAKIALLHATYWLCLLASAGLAMFDIGKYFAPALLFGMLFLTIATIPFELAWSEKMFRNLLIQTGVSIGFSIFIYGVLYWKSGLVVAGKLVQVPLSEAIYFSAATWTTVIYGDPIPPPNLKLLTIAEAFNAYLAMAVLVALIILWIEQSLASAQRYLHWLEGARRSEIESVTGLKIEELIEKLKAKKENQDSKASQTPPADQDIPPI